MGVVNKVQCPMSYEEILIMSVPINVQYLIKNQI